MCKILKRRTPSTGTLTLEDEPVDRLRQVLAQLGLNHLGNQWTLVLFEPSTAEKTVEAVWGKCPLIVVTENKTMRATLMKMESEFVVRLSTI